MSKTEGQGPATNTLELPFEQALHKLEEIVGAMESEDLPLEQLLAKYEEGSRLVKVCQAKLSDAELKIQRLERDESGKLTARPLSANE